VVNNRRIFRFAPLEQASEELVRRKLRANVTADLRGAGGAAGVARLPAAPIINISSAAGHKPSPGGAHYAASKAAVNR